MAQRKKENPDKKNKKDPSERSASQDEQKSSSEQTKEDEERLQKKLDDQQKKAKEAAGETTSGEGEQGASSKKRERKEEAPHREGEHREKGAETRKSLMQEYEKLHDHVEVLVNQIHETEDQIHETERLEDQLKKIRDKAKTIGGQKHKSGKEKSKAQAAREQEKESKRMLEDQEEKASEESKKQETPKKEDETASGTSQRKEKFHIVGIGASAGGLDAFEQFFSETPSDTGMAFVLVSHLDPSHVSILSDLLQKHTKMEVAQVEDGTEVKPDHVYVIPPNKDLAILNGALQLIDTEVDGKLRMPIDYFLRSLAEDQGEWAICVILSGMGSDGALGLKAIKGELGMAMVQEPETAKYNSMPTSAIRTGLADYVLPPGQMAEQLLEYAKHIRKKPASKYLENQGKLPDALQKIFILIRSATGHDFSQYKQNTILRRVQRRMSVHRLEDIFQYVRYLRQNQPEVHLLFKELLIGVTSFFRDPEAFDALKNEGLLPLLKKKSDDYPLRAWVPGCSSGEEAYSVAILIRECMDELDKNFEAQIFATDIDSDAIEAARQGSYPLSISADISKERLDRYFYRDDSMYRIKKDIREMVVFAPQNMIKDPPFTKLDLISCRNLLIYLGSELQKKLLPLFHYALKPEGILFLGSSETVGTHVDLFATLERRWKIFRRKETAVHPPVTAFPTGQHEEQQRNVKSKKEERISFGQMTENMLLNDFAPPGLLINEKGEILYVHGRTGKYLEPATGIAKMHIADMAREGLKSEIPYGIRRASTQKKDITYKNLRVKTNGEFQNVDLTIKYVNEPESMRGLMLVVFQDAPATEEKTVQKTKDKTDRHAISRIDQLEKELQHTKEDLQTTIEEIETSNEELKSTNEELQSTNEELQSSNEELETSKEEQQSLNEELTTVNSELQGKIDELSSTYDDMKNLLEAIEVPTIFLDSDLNIKRFTAHSSKLINLINADHGRPLRHIVSNLKYDGLVEDCRTVLATLNRKQKEVQTEEGRWYSVRISPYRTISNVIDGVVITLLDVHEQKQAEEKIEKMKDEIQEARDYAENIVDTVREPLLVLDNNLQVVSANRSFYDTFRVSAEKTKGTVVYELGNKQWNIPRLRELLEEILPKNSAFDDFEVEHDFPKIGKRKMLLNGRKMKQQKDEQELILLAIEDVTDNA